MQHQKHQTGKAPRRVHMKTANIAITHSHQQRAHSHTQTSIGPTLSRGSLLSLRRSWGRPGSSELILHTDAGLGHCASSLAGPGSFTGLVHRRSLGGWRIAENPFAVGNSRRPKRCSRHRQVHIFGLSLSVCQLETRQQFYYQVRNEKKSALRNGTEPDAQSSVPRPRGLSTSLLSVQRSHAQPQSQQAVVAQILPRFSCILTAVGLRPVVAAGRLGPDPVWADPVEERTPGSKLSFRFFFSNDNMTRSRFNIRFGRGGCWSFSATFISIINEHRYCQPARTKHFTLKNARFINVTTSRT